MYCNDKNEKNYDVWYLDNGASNHMIDHSEKFHELDESITMKVKFDDGSTIQIVEKGMIVLECKTDD